MTGCTHPDLQIRTAGVDLISEAGQPIVIASLEVNLHFLNRSLVHFKNDFGKRISTFFHAGKRCSVEFECRSCTSGMKHEKRNGLEKPRCECSSSRRRTPPRHMILSYCKAALKCECMYSFDYRLLLHWEAVLRGIDADCRGQHPSWNLVHQLSDFILKDPRIAVATPGT